MRVNSTIPILADGNIDSAAWLDLLAHHYQDLHLCAIKRAVELCRQQGSALSSQYGLNYFAHSISMAAILTELKADHETVIAGCLYSLVNDRIITLESVQTAFGNSVAKIIKSAANLPIDVIKQKNLNSQTHQAERYRKMILAMVNDVRVVLVKLAECICIMRAIKKIEPARRELLALEIMNIYAPLANRLGIGQIKWELEDRAFACLQPKPYLQIKNYLHEKRADREQYVEEVKQQLLGSLQHIGIKAEVSGRAKHIYSIWRKMQAKQISFERLFDVLALRVLVPDVANCYAALSCVHELWSPISAEFRDYISSPKPNGYQSIHTIVIGPKLKRIEVQIRSYAMHEESEKGLAAHWRYKEGVVRDAKLENRINWLRSLLEWQKEVTTENQELAQAKLADESIYVLTPQGEVIDLPKGATPLDFAYRIHTEVGHRCQGAKVNGKLVPLHSSLQTTDKVEILLGKQSKPSRDWLSRKVIYIVTAHARNKIQQWFRQQEGTKTHEGMEAVTKEVTQELPFEITSKSKSQARHDDIIVYGVDNLLTRAAGCCRPIMGDAVLGYITQGRGITVHRADCSIVQKVKPEHKDRLVEVKWGENTKARYPVDLTIYAKNHANLLKDLTQLLAHESLNIMSLQTMLDHVHDVSVIYILMEIQNTQQMQRILNLIQQLPGVIEVKRGR